MYAATNPLAAIVEYLGFDAAAIVSQAMLKARRVYTMHYDIGFPLARPANPSAISLGVTAELTSSPDYDVPQRWSTALAASGFEGIWYASRFAGGVNPSSLALFDTAGPHPTWPVVSYESAGSADLIAGLQRIGINVVPAPQLTHLQVIT